MAYSSSNAMRLHLNMACINRCGMGGIPNRFSCPAFETGMTWNFKLRAKGRRITDTNGTDVMMMTIATTMMVTAIKNGVSYL